MASGGLTRFAPAPTGVLHLGHVASAIYVWGFGRRLSAEVLLRIEDHDRQRSRPEYETQLLEDLDWLGFVPHRYPSSTFRAGRCDSRQSDRSAVYESVVEDLRSRGLVYGCRCSRQDRSDPTIAAGPSRCVRGCGDEALELSDTLAWRVRLGGQQVAPPRDLLLGEPSSSQPAAVIDPVIRDRHGNWTYQFAVVVDDWKQGINLVIRGRDLLDSTPLQIAISAAIGRRVPPRFAHHPLVMKSPSAKLSKSDGDTGIGALRRAGWTPGAVIGHAAHLAGLCPAGQSIAAVEAGLLFDYSSGSDLSPEPVQV